MHLKNTRNSLSALVLLILSQQAHAQALPELQPRDLDGDSSTIEAYYFQPQNITWLADSNLGKSNAFGLERGGLYSSDGNDNFSVDIDFSGQMFKETVDPFISAVNQSNYLGYSSWRLPHAITVSFPDGAEFTGAEAPDFNQVLVENFGGRTAAQFPELNDDWVVWLSSFGTTGRHVFTFGTTDRGEIGQLETCPIMGGVRNCQPAAVWLVHDGDIGTPVNTSECIDTEPMNDGWGWDGSSSCQIEVVNPACVDSPPIGDGWGWNGIESCRVSPGENVICVDTAPVGDGWGWDGGGSCRLEVVNPTCIDSPPTGDGWGWNGITSCRVQSNADGLTDVERFRGYQYCPDTSPISDGWGWTGSESCRVEPNLINNGDFSQGATDWIPYVHPSAEETSFDLTKDLRLSYRDAGSQWWHSQAYTTPILLQGGRTYRLEFNHESGGKTGAAIGSVVVENGENYTAYLPRTDFFIGISAQRLQADFYVPVTDSNARVTFNLGDNAGGSNSANIGTIWLDNIVLKEIN